MFRSSAHELGYYPDRRGTERPEAYLRRGLVRVFEERGLYQVTSGVAPRLDVELVALEVMPSRQSKSRVQVVIALERNSHVQAEPHHHRGSSCPLLRLRLNRRAEAQVEALGSALQNRVAQVADLVAARLKATPERPTPTP